MNRSHRVYSRTPKIDFFGVRCFIYWHDEADEQKGQQILMPPHRYVSLVAFPISGGGGFGNCAYGNN